MKNTEKDNVPPTDEQNKSNPPTPPDPPATPSEPEFTIERLREDCMKLFGVTACCYDAAVSTLEGKFTLKAMKAHIEEWKVKPAVPKKKGG
jgi:hypothetical protein